jgi:5'-methylthioadenosine phosphorylase
VGRLAVIAGSSLREQDLPEGDWEVLQRHGESAAYLLPHRIDHVANLRAVDDAGCDRVLAIGSVGGLRPELGPGTLLCPHDFIALDAEPIAPLAGPEAHQVPGFDPGWRQEVLAALSDAGAEVLDRGVYWQATGPRLETPAEVRLIAQHADVVGMTVASECAVASALGIRYAALCVVVNLANGVGETELTLEEILAHGRQVRSELADLLASVLPRLARVR